MLAEHRLWRTDAGDLVPDGHQDAQVLAYAAGDLLSIEDSGALSRAKAAPVKSESAPPNKARRAPRNKGR